ncbi:MULTISPECIES: hypothetical protein [Aeromonas]|uniref:hypothetical protein n=1 Tax=Aeromonas TaxID=642 RepID=UPI0020791FFA|nr:MULTISPECIES: hypothetical protein [Aeromonas]USJ75431.1 hypothetical protein LDP97_12350 [Aeromonas hydrophila]WRT71841.1 hypothetical protein VK677_16065 [Aeromonas dhakensis]HDX8463529.1 hypothetical protein [Aeromonas dhakensis]HDX8487317.1 hypothetical protein [Aeromonas dhakensis]HDX8514165.1 hypothetical protein [Aeromonas dhakensis]
MSRPFISQVLKEPLTLEELNKHWHELGRCEFGAVYCRSGGLVEDCEVLALLQERALTAINNRGDTIDKFRGDWRTKRKQLTPEQARWCEVSLCVQLAELAPDMRTGYESMWRVGHQGTRGVKPSHQTDLINDWLRGIVKNYERLIENEERIGLSLVLDGEVNVYPSEIINAAKLLAKVKKTEEKERDENAKALLTSIEEARAKFAEFGIGTCGTKESACWILLLADAWELEPDQIRNTVRSITRRTKGQK